jgi:hypothetical protein
MSDFASHIPAVKTQEDVKARLDSFSRTLCGPARTIGRIAARKLFHGRGNHSEVHLSEYELAAVIAASIETYVQVKAKKGK